MKNNETITVGGLNFLKVNNDINGNPRYVIHFMDIPMNEQEKKVGIIKRYDLAIDKVKKIGGKKYDVKSYGGGIVFQSFNIRETAKMISKL